MRALLLSHSGGTGGATRSLQAVAVDLQAAGCDVDIIAPAGNMQDEWQEAGITVLQWKPPYCPWMFGPVYASGVVNFHIILVALLGMLPLRIFSSWKVLSHVFKNETYDCVHVNSLTLFPLTWVLPLVFRKQKKRPKVIWHLRELLNPGLIFPVRKMIVRMLCKQADHIIAISENEAEPFRQHPSIEVVYNTIPSKWVGVETQNRESNSGVIKIVMASALSPAKGILEYLEAADKLCKRYSNVYFDLYTPNAPVSFLSKFPANPETESGVNKMLESVRSIALSERVRWNFGCSITPELYREYSVYVRPDRAACPWGRDIIEAMWMGMPVIATGDYDGFVGHGVTGFLIPPGDVTALEEKLAMLIEDASLRDSMGNAAQEKAFAMFSPDTHAQKIQRAFGLKG